MAGTTTVARRAGSAPPNMRRHQETGAEERLLDDDEKEESDDIPQSSSAPARLSNLGSEDSPVPILRRVQTGEILPEPLRRAVAQVVPNEDGPISDPEWENIQLTLTALIDMGFEYEAAQEAAYYVLASGGNGGVEAAVEYLTSGHLFDDGSPVLDDDTIAELQRVESETFRHIHGGGTNQPSMQLFHMRPRCVTSVTSMLPAGSPHDTMHVREYPPPPASVILGDDSPIDIHVDDDGEAFPTSVMPENACCICMEVRW